MPRVKRWVEERCIDTTLNLFAGINRLNCDEYRVDIDPEADADHHGDACDFLMAYKGPRFKTVVLDPPYNIRKAREKYDGRYVGSLTKIKDVLKNAMEPGTTIISFGYDSVGLSAKRGCVKKEILLVCHGGDHNDTIAVVEEFVQPGLF